MVGTQRWMIFWPTLPEWVVSSVRHGVVVAVSSRFSRMPHDNDMCSCIMPASLVHNVRVTSLGFMGHGQLDGMQCFAAHTATFTSAVLVC